MFGLGIGEAVIILFVVVLLFGGKKLPALGKALGHSITSFKTGLKDHSDADENKGQAPSEDKDKK
jgi:sec-independent protein translocase protein TatA